MPMPKPTRSGQENACPRKRNGSSRPAEVLAGKPYVWGDSFRPNSNWMANTHQGQFPPEDSGEDGCIGIAPVAQYPPNDMVYTTWREMSDSGRATGMVAISS